MPLLERVRHHVRLKHSSIRTEEAYVQAVRRFILFHGKRHPSEMGAEEVRQYLSHLANVRNVAASMQNQALSALLILYREVLAIDLPFVEGIAHAKRPARVPTVLTREEARRLLANLSGVHRLKAGLLYGAGLRLMECVRLRIKDVDFGYGQITVRDGKGEKDRRTLATARTRSRSFGFSMATWVSGGKVLKALAGTGIIHASGRAVRGRIRLLQPHYGIRPNHSAFATLLRS